jgi:hypothetical protein
MIGDDLVIHNCEVASEYMSILSETGIEINTDDTIFPTPEKSYEIAKRLFRNNKEISPIPMNLYDTSRSLFYWTHFNRYLDKSLTSSDPYLRDRCAALMMYFFTTESEWCIPIIYNGRTSINFPEWSHLNDDLSISMEVPESTDKDTIH